MTSIFVYNESPDTELNANRNFKYETVVRRQQTHCRLGNIKWQHGNMPSADPLHTAV